MAIGLLNIMFNSWCLLLHLRLIPPSIHQPIKLHPDLPALQESHLVAWCSSTRSPITVFSLSVISLEMIWYTPSIKLIGLNSFNSFAPHIFGINVIKVLTKTTTWVVKCNKGIIQGLLKKIIMMSTFNFSQTKEYIFKILLLYMCSSIYELPLLSNLLINID